MRRIVMRVRAADVDAAYDRLLPCVRGGLHPCEDGDHVRLVALGDPAALPSLAALVSAGGGLLVEPPVDEDAGDDLEAALAALVPRIEIGGRIVLRTAAHPPPPDDWIDVVLARDVGFGTGEHPTTRHVLELLLDIVPGGAFADLGCGAGAITIAAAKLGYDPVVGVEAIDAVAASAYRNAEANGVRADFVTGDLRALGRLDVRVAVVNVSEPEVHAGVAVADLPELELLIVSGLSAPERLATALAAYERAGFVERRRIDRKGWPAVLMASATARAPALGVADARAPSA